MVLEQNKTNMENRLKTLPKILGHANKALITGSVLSISAFLLIFRKNSEPIDLRGFPFPIPPELARYILIFMAVGCSFLIYSWIKQGLNILRDAEFEYGISIEEIQSHLHGGLLLCGCPLLARLLLVVSFISLLIATKSIIFGIVIGLFSILYLISSINVRLGFFCSNRWEPVGRTFIWRFFKPKTLSESEKAETMMGEYTFMACARAIRRDGMMFYWSIFKDDEYYERNIKELMHYLRQYLSDHEIFEHGRNYLSDHEKFELMLDNLKQHFPEYEDAENSSDD